MKIPPSVVQGLNGRVDGRSSHPQREHGSGLGVGDPVTGQAFTITTGGAFPFTYHPEDLVFLPWFARITPSTSVNEWYTFLNGFAAPQPVCH